MEIAFLEKDTLTDLFLQVEVEYTNGNAGKLAFVCPDAPLVGHDASPTTPSYPLRSFSKKILLSSRSYPLVHSLLSAPGATEIDRDA